MARRGPEVVERDVVEAVHERLVDDAAATDDPGAQDADRRVGRQLHPAAPVELAVAVELVARVGVAVHVLASLEEQDPQASLAEVARHDPAARAGPDDDRVVPAGALGRLRSGQVCSGHDGVPLLDDKSMRTRRIQSL